MTILRRSTLFVVAAALALVTALPAAASTASVLGTDNTVYLLRAGSMAELSGDKAAGDHSALALDITRPDGQTDHLLVPGTQGQEVEGNTAVFFDPSRDAVYLVWESSYEAFSPYSRVLLASYGPDGWSDPLQLSLSHYVEKSSPQLALTHDEVSYETGDGEMRTANRTILHLAWIEERDAHTERVLYSPILFSEGRYQHLNAPIELGALAGGAASEETGVALEQGILSLHRGSDMQSIIVVAAPQGSAKISSWELKAIPGALSAVADAFNDLILAQTTLPEGPAAVSLLEKEAHAILEQAGNQVSRSFVTLAKEEVSSFLRREHGDLAEFTDEARSLLLNLGERLDQGSVQHVTGSGRPHWINFGARGTTAPGGPRTDSRSHHVSLRTVAQLSVPEAMTERPAALLNSRRGSDFIAYWEEGDRRLYYQESQAGGWSDAAHIALEGDVTAGDAVRLLQERLDNR